MVPVYETQPKRDKINAGDIYNEHTTPDTAYSKTQNTTMTGRRKLIRLDGLLGSVIDKIRKNLNFDMEFISVRGFGVKTDNGSYNGVLGMVQRRVSLVVQHEEK